MFPFDDVIIKASKYSDTNADIRFLLTGLSDSNLKSESSANSFLNNSRKKKHNVRNMLCLGEQIPKIIHANDILKMWR